MANALLTLALLGVLALHLAAAGLAAAGPFVALAFDVCGTRRDDRGASAVGRWLLVQSTAALVLASGLGIIALGGVWRLFPNVVAVTVGRFPTERYLFGAVELGFSFACQAACLALWPLERPTSARRRWLRRSLGVLAATNTIYHFPTLFAALTVMSAWTPSLEERRFVTVLVEPETLARVAHFIPFAFVATGAWIVVRACQANLVGSQRSEEDPPTQADRMARWGGAIALAAGALSLVSGVGVLAAVDAGERELLLGGDLLATGLLGAAVVSSLGLLHASAKVALGEVSSGARRGMFAALAIVLLLMVGVRQRTRELTVGPREAEAAKLRAIRPLESGSSR
jgi:hypothetical protein